MKIKCVSDLSVCGILFEKSESDERARRLKALYLRSLRLEEAMGRNDLHEQLQQVDWSGCLCSARDGNTRG